MSCMWDLASNVVSEINHDQKTERVLAEFNQYLRHLDSDGHRNLVTTNLKRFSLAYLLSGPIVNQKMIWSPMTRILQQSLDASFIWSLSDISVHTSSWKKILSFPWCCVLHPTLFAGAVGSRFSSSIVAAGNMHIAIKLKSSVCLFVYLT